MKVFIAYLSFPKIPENILLSVLYEEEIIFKGLLKKINKCVFKIKSENVNFYTNYL